MIWISFLYEELPLHVPGPRRACFDDLSKITNRIGLGGYVPERYERCSEVLIFGSRNEERFQEEWLSEHLQVNEFDGMIHFDFHFLTEQVKYASKASKPS